MVVLVLNCGSSSLKYQVLDMRSESDYTLLAKGLVERIGMGNGVLIHKVEGLDKFVKESPVPDHTVGIREVLNIITDTVYGVVKSLAEIKAVGHRVAHGGEKFASSVVVTPEVVKEIEGLCELAPLHNPANLLGINAVSSILPTVPQVAVFDTSFHQTMPDYAFTYAIPYEYYTNYKIRRYGFHGSSHKYVVKQGCRLAGVDLENSKVISCHLGNGSSITAIKNGKSVDTSMGFTPLEGLMMGTRCGDIDGGIITYLQAKLNLDASGINQVLNKQSGFMGVYGRSSDARDVEAAALNGDYRAKLTLDILFYRILKYIGSYSAAMNGVDLIIFTGGIGENDCELRERVCTHLEYMGVDFDSEVNKNKRGVDLILSKSSSKIKVCTISTNEELVIATDTMNLVNINR